MFASASAAHAEEHSLTLRQVLDLAARQNSDVLLARLDAQRAEQGIRIARDPFVPKVYAGSGLAYTYGFPASIDGSAPSVVQVRSSMSIYNRPQSYELAESRENARGAHMDAQAKSDEVAYRAAVAFLDAFELSKEVSALAGAETSLAKVAETMAARVQEGAELPVEGKRAHVNLAVARQRGEAARDDLEAAEIALAVVAGFPASDRVHAVESAKVNGPEFQSEQECIDLAIRNHKELQRLQSSVMAKQLEMRAQNSQRLPQVNLVAQYELFAKYNNFQEYFTRFQRNNAELGISVLFPLLGGTAVKGLMEQAATDIAKLRLQINDTRNQVTLNARRGFLELRKAESARELAREQLELARDDLSVLISQMTEGRVLLSRVEQARVAENDRWLAWYAADTNLERARLALLRDTGTLVAALNAGPDSNP
jgi:outer membrane protein